jgi:hypothetical protein
MVERIPVGAVFGLARWVGDALVGEFHIVGRDLAEAVGPGDAGLELKFDVRRVRRLDRHRQVFLPRPLVARLEPYEAAHDRAHDFFLDDALPVAGVEDRGIEVGARLQHLRGLRAQRGGGGKRGSASGDGAFQQVAARQ